jgi:hypothetical protein
MVGGCSRLALSTLLVATISVLACEEATESADVHLRLRQPRDDRGVDGLRVRACPKWDEGEARRPAIETRDGGFASVPIARSESPGSCFTIDGRVNRPLQVVRYSSALRAGQHEVLRLTDEALPRRIEARLSAPVVETRALIEAQAYDHNRQRASAFGIAVTVASGTRTTPARRIRR